MKKSTFVKEIKIWMKRNGLKRKAVYIHDGGDLFLHWRLQSKIDGHFINLIAKKDLDPFDNECILLTMSSMKKLGENIFSLESDTVERVLLPFEN